MFVIFSVSYSQLVQFSLETAHNSVRKAIADLCNVSPLRVVDIHVSEAPAFFEMYKLKGLNNMKPIHSDNRA